MKPIKLSEAAQATVDRGKWGAPIDFVEGTVKTARNVVAKARQEIPKRLAVAQENVTAELGSIRGSAEERRARAAVAVMTQRREVDAQLSEVAAALSGERERIEESYRKSFATQVAAHRDAVNATMTRLVTASPKDRQALIGSKNPIIRMAIAELPAEVISTVPQTTERIRRELYREIRPDIAQAEDDLVMLADQSKLIASTFSREIERVMPAQEAADLEARLTGEQRRASNQQPELKEVGAA